MIYEVLGVGLLSLCCSVFVLTNFEGVPSGAPVAGCDDHGSCIIQTHRSASADRRTNNKLHSTACSCECSAVPRRVGRRRHRSLCGRTRAPAGSALSWTPHVSSARITKYGLAPTVLVTLQQQPRYKLEMPDSSHCQCHCSAHYTSHYCGEPCCPQCMGQRSRAVLSEILYSKYC